MSLFRQTNLQKYTPKTLKLSQLYRFATKSSGQIDSSVKEQIKKSLTQAGYSEEKIDKIIYHDPNLTPTEIQEISQHLNKSQIYGFTKNPTFLIKDYLNKERVKAQSIAGIRKEHMLESRQEPLVVGPTSHLGGDRSNVTTLGRGAGPTTPPGEGKAPAMTGSGKRVNTSF